jgi:hypothetical protein
MTITLKDIRGGTVDIKVLFTNDGIELKQPKFCDDPTGEQDRIFLKDRQFIQLLGYYFTHRSHLQ